MRWMSHNPAFLPPADLLRQFVVHHDALAEIRGVVEENDGPVNQHVLIIAPRGRGKTTLVHRLALALRSDPTLASRWHPIVFGEESYQIATLGELWLEALLHLADATNDPRLRTAWEALRVEPDERRLVDAARARLLDFADAQGKRLVLIVENLDMLLEQQVDVDDAWALRGTLLNEPRIMLMGTATQRFPGVEQPDQPMFDLFRRVELPALSDAECERLWTAVTGHAIGARRAAAIRILTGGNPRLVVLMASFADGRDLSALVADLAHLIDQHTDYFKHNIEALSTQQRRVFLALAELWAPATAREVAAACRLDVSKTSAVLKRLEQDGRVEIVATRSGAHHYQVTERLYNIYHLMRRHGGAAPRVRAVLDFIRHFYEPTEASATSQSPTRLLSYAVVLDEVLDAPESVARRLVAADANAPAERLFEGALVTFDPSKPMAVAAIVTLRGRDGRARAALEAVAPALRDAAFVGAHLDVTTTAAMRLAAAGLAAEVLAVLRDAPSAPLVEPLVVALADLSGAPIDAPIEVREVAAHVRARVLHLARTADPWRTDPHTLPLDDPKPSEGYS